MTASLTPNVPGSRGLVNLAAELEDRLGGTPVSSGFDESTSALLPSASGYVLVVFDGLGSRQLDIVEARELAACKVDDLIAPFPTTTTVSLASIATGLSPARHGLVGYQLYLPHLDVVANTIKWTTLW
ncbi:MAG: alkaline phosphatase family protein, partial [Acidimicrobiia bacterium]|nr:alkaline phosphatase family protein [Acidimicrobiia bacterium]NNL27988.1 hypothetical protein [Acidimicrobiia bacterium]